MGFVPGIKAFTAAVLGGIGNIPGAMLGGLFLGLIEADRPDAVPDGFGVPAPNQLKDVIAFTMLVLVLVFRPSGILGERVTRSARERARATSRPTCSRTDAVAAAGTSASCSGSASSAAASRIYLCLVGIVPVFDERPLIDGVIALGQTALLITFAAVGYLAARPFAATSRVRSVVGGRLRRRDHRRAS